MKVLSTKLICLPKSIIVCHCIIKCTASKKNNNNIINDSCSFMEDERSYRIFFTSRLGFYKFCSSVWFFVYESTIKPQKRLITRILHYVCVCIIKNDGQLTVFLYSYHKVQQQLQLQPLLQISISIRQAVISISIVFAIIRTICTFSKLFLTRTYIVCMLCTKRTYTILYA